MKRAVSIFGDTWAKLNLVVDKSLRSKESRESVSSICHPG